MNINYGNTYKLTTYVNQQLVRLIVQDAMTLNYFLSEYGRLTFPLVDAKGYINNDQVNYDGASRIQHPIFPMI